MDFRRPPIRMEWRDHDVAVRRKESRGLQVFRRHRAAAESVRKNHYRIALLRVGPDRRLPRALHMRNRGFAGYRIVRPSVGRGGRIADERDELDRMAGEA